MIKDIIRIYNDRDSLYGNKLTNHLNMGLYALYRLGADEDRINAYAKEYIQFNQLPEASEVKVTIKDKNFEDYLGMDGYYSSYIPYFLNEFKDQDRNQVVSKYLNRFIDGSAGGAFHGLIRLAYAYELDDIEELAKALAYFAECYHPFPMTDVMKSSMQNKNPITAILDFSNMKYFKEKEFKRQLIVGRMMDVYEDVKFAKEITGIDDELCNSEYFGELLLKLYALTEDFTMLHGFTSTHALRVLSHLINDYPLELKRHWYHLQMAYLSTNCTEIQEVPFVPKLMSWEQINKKLVGVKDVHTIKLVYSLFQQSKNASADSLYRTMAQLKVEKSY